MSMSKREMSYWLERWGLVVEGDETHAELSQAYSNMKIYRTGGRPYIRNENIPGTDLYVPRLRPGSYDVPYAEVYPVQVVGHAGGL